MNDSLEGLSQERIYYLARIGAIFERLLNIKNLHNAEYVAIINAGFTAKLLGELGETNERIEEIMRRSLLPDRHSFDSWLPDRGDKREGESGADGGQE